MKQRKFLNSSATVKLTQWKTFQWIVFVFLLPTMFLHLLRISISTLSTITTSEILSIDVIEPKHFHYRNTNHTCLQHPPLYAHQFKLKFNATATATTTTTLTNNTQNQNYTLLQQPTPSQCGTLKRSWNTSSSSLSPLAQTLFHWQSNCSIPTATFVLDNSYGFGSHLYLFSQALCNAMEMNTRVRTVIATHEPWLWWDTYHCSTHDFYSSSHSNNNTSSSSATSPWDCYFPSAEPSCPITTTTTTTTTTNQSSLLLQIPNPRNPKLRCQRLRDTNNTHTLQEFRAATMEYIFHTISPLVLQEASRQMGLLFPMYNGYAPDDLITVHIRWGDKFWEMDLVPIEQYITAVQQFVDKDNNNNNNNNSTTSSSMTPKPVHIYLATEDPRAADAFVTAAPDHWNIYIDRTLMELVVVRPNRGNRASWMTKNTQGRAGLMNVASWLIALEANRFVLTTASNWSRIVNVLRQTKIDPYCNNCTQLIDLRPGVW